MPSFMKKLFIAFTAVLAFGAAAHAAPVEYYLVPHFHWDLAYRNTESGYKTLGNVLIGQYLTISERDPDYRFILDQVPLVKAYTDKTPGGMKKLRGLAAEGRLEISGAMYEAVSKPIKPRARTADNKCK